MYSGNKRHSVSHQGNHLVTQNNPVHQPNFASLEIPVTLLIDGNWRPITDFLNDGNAIANGLAYNPSWAVSQWMKHLNDNYLILKDKLHPQQHVAIMDLIAKFAVKRFCVFH